MVIHKDPKRVGVKQKRYFKFKKNVNVNIDVDFS